MLDGNTLDAKIAETIRQNMLYAGDLSRPAAVCALWKDLGHALEGQALDDLAVIGNLFTPRGLGLMIRSLWLMTSIRYLVVWGPDTTRTGFLLFRLWEDGLDDQHAIPGTGIGLDPAIPREAVDHLRRSVRLIDLRKTRDFADVVRALRELPHLPAHAEPRLFPESAVVVPATLPSLGTGFHAEAATLSRAWLQALHLVLQFGTVKPSEHRLAQKEILGLTTVVRPESPASFHLPRYLPVTRAQIEDYVPLVVEDRMPDGLAYTYGRRLRSYFGRDQVAEMSRRLHRVWYTRRATAVLWDSSRDSESENPPCITQVVANVVGTRLFLTYLVRSQEMFEGWLLNTLAMRELQRRLSLEEDLEPGPLASFTVSAHVYEDRWHDAERALAEHYRASAQPFDPDPRGNFLIRFHDGRYVAELLSPGGDQVVWRGENADAYQLGLEIVRLGLASLPEHLLYLGWELCAAARSSVGGSGYVQGRAG